MESALSPQKHHTSAMSTILLGLLCILITVSSLIFIGNRLDHIPAISLFDRIVYESINRGPHPVWLRPFVDPFNFNFLPWGGTFFPSFIYFVFMIGFLSIAIWYKKNLGWAIAAILIAILIDTFLFKLMNASVLRERPFLHLLNSLSESDKAIWKNWPTYPSGHVRDMALYSSVLTGYAPKLFWPFVILTLWIGFTRIYLGAHYPTDVLAGLALGYFVGYGILLIVKSIQRLGEKSQTSL